MNEKRNSQKFRLVPLICFIVLLMGIFSATVFANDITVDFSMMTWNTDFKRDCWLDKVDFIKSLHPNLVGVQEAFPTPFFNLYEAVDTYNYKISHKKPTGTNIKGSGLVVFSDFKIESGYTIKVSWDDCKGDLLNEAFGCAFYQCHDCDCLAEKGFVFSRIELPLGSSGTNQTFPVDFYNLHADAGRPQEDFDARVKQFIQLKEFMEIYSTGKPVIVVGDFNLQGIPGEESELGFLNLFMSQPETGLTMVNDDYIATSASGYKFDYILIRSGAEPRVKLEKVNYEVLSNIQYSDHYPVKANLRYTVKYDAFPDLYPVALQLDMTNMQDLKAIIKNNGPANVTVPFSVRLSRTMDSGRVNVRTDVINSLASGASCELTYFFVQPLELNPERPEIDIEVDAGCDISENNEYNNSLSGYTELPQPYIKLTAPNGGENWTVGSSHNITWSSSGTIANVKIEYSTNTGSTWSNIVASTANDGIHPWTIPNTPSTTCRVRVSDAADNDPSDTSDANFTIKAATPLPSLIVNGGFESSWTGWPDKYGKYALSTPAYKGSKACKLTGFSYGSNLITNGGFESSWTAWPTKSGNYSLSTVRRSGSYSCQLTGQAAAESGVASNAYTVQGGATYELTSYVKYVSGSGNYKVTIAWLNSSSGVIRYDNDWKGTNKLSAFTYHGGKFQAPANAVSAKILLGVSANTSFLFDDVALELYQLVDSSVVSSVYAAQAGKQYKLNSYVKYVSGSGNYKVTIAWLNSSNGVIRYDNDWKGTNRPASYTYHGGSFTAPASTAKVRVILGVAQGTVYLFDEIELIPQS